MLSSTLGLPMETAHPHSQPQSQPQQQDENDVAKLRNLYKIRWALQAENKTESRSLADAISALEERGSQQRRSSKTTPRTSIGRRVAHGHGRSTTTSRYQMKMEKRGKICVFENVTRDPGVGLVLCNEDPSELSSSIRPGPLRTHASPSSAGSEQSSQGGDDDRDAVDEDETAISSERVSECRDGHGSGSEGVDDGRGARSKTKGRHIFVQTVVNGGEADRHGFIRSGDRLLEINSQPVPGRSLHDARAMLGEAERGGRVVLAVGVVGTPAALALRERHFRCKSDSAATSMTTSRDSEQEVESSGGGSESKSRRSHHAHAQHRRLLSEPMYPLSDGDDPIFRDFANSCCLPGSAAEHWGSSSSIPAATSSASSDTGFESGNAASGGKARSASTLPPTQQQQQQQLQLQQQVAVQQQKSSSLKRGDISILKGLQRKLSTKSNSQRKIVIDKDPLVGYGLEVQGGRGSLLGDIDVLVRRIEPDSSAGRCGKLKQGDHIVQINSLATEGMTHDDVISILRTSQGPLELVVAETSVTWAGDSLPRRCTSAEDLPKMTGTGVSRSSAGASGGSGMEIPAAAAKRIGRDRLSRRGSSDHIFTETGSQVPIRSRSYHSDAGSNDEGSPGRVQLRSKHLSLLNRPRSREIPPGAQTPSDERMSKFPRLAKLLTRSSDNVGADVDDSASPQSLLSTQQQQQQVPSHPQQVVQAWARNSSVDSSSNNSPAATGKRQFVLTETIVLAMHAGKLGFTIVGGWMDDNTCRPVCVKSVMPDLLAHRDGRMKRGDEIIAANGQNLSGMTLQEAKLAIKSACGLVTLEVRHQAPPSIRQQIFVSFNCGDTLGFAPTVVQDKDADSCQVYVLKVDRSSEAACHLRAGDHLLSINNHSLLCQSMQRVKDVFAELKPDLTLKVERMTRPGADVSSSESGIGSISSLFRRSLCLTSCATDLNSSEASLDSSTSNTMSTSSVPSTCSSGEFDPMSVSSDHGSTDNILLEAVAPSLSDSDADNKEDSSEDVTALSLGIDTAKLTDDPFADEDKDEEEEEEMAEEVTGSNKRLDMAILSELDPLMRTRAPSVDKHRRNSRRFMKSVSDFLCTDYHVPQVPGKTEADRDAYLARRRSMLVNTPAIDISGVGEVRSGSPLDAVWSEDAMSLHSRRMTADKSSLCSEDTLRGSEYDTVSHTSSLVAGECYEEQAYECSSITAPRSFQLSSSTLSRLLGAAKLAANSAANSANNTNSGNTDAHGSVTSTSRVDSSTGTPLLPLPDAYNLNIRLTLAKDSQCGFSLRKHPLDSGNGGHAWIVDTIVHGSPAHVGGLKVGDVVLRINDRQLDDDIMPLQDDVTLLVCRQSSARTLSVGSTASAATARRVVNRGSSHRLSERNLKTGASPLTQPSIPVASSDWSPDITQRKSGEFSNGRSGGSSNPSSYVALQDSDSAAAAHSSQREDAGHTEYSDDEADGTGNQTMAYNAAKEASAVAAMMKDGSTATAAACTLAGGCAAEAALNPLPRRVLLKRKRRVNVNARRLQADGVSADGESPPSAASMEHRSSIDSVESHDSSCVSCSTSSHHEHRPRAHTTCTSTPAAAAATADSTATHRLCTASSRTTAVATAGHATNGSGAGDDDLLPPSAPPRSLSLSREARNLSSSSVDSLRSPDSGFCSLSRDNQHSNNQLSNSQFSYGRKSSSLGRVGEAQSDEFRATMSTPDSIESPDILLSQQQRGGTTTDMPVEDNAVQPYARSSSIIVGNKVNTTSPPKRHPSPRKLGMTETSNHGDIVKTLSAQRSVSASALRSSTSLPPPASRKQPSLQHQQPLHLNVAVPPSSSVDSGISTVSNTSLPTYHEYAANPDTFPSHVSVSATATLASPVRRANTQPALPTAGGGGNTSAGDVPPSHSRRSNSLNVMESIYMNTGAESSQRPTPVYENLNRSRSQQVNPDDPYSDYEVMHSPRNSALLSPPSQSSLLSLSSGGPSTATLPIMEISDGSGGNGGGGAGGGTGVSSLNRSRDPAPPRVSAAEVLRRLQQSS